MVVVGYDIAPKGNGDGLAGLKAGGLWRRERPLRIPALALCAGTLDQMVDQVTRSVVFIQKQYPHNRWVSLQIVLLSRNVGGRWILPAGRSPAAPTGLRSRSQAGTP